MTASTVLTVSENEPPPAEVVARAVEALARGEIVGIPTETVYGLAARADDPAALARLGATKSSAAGRPFTLHVGSQPAFGEPAVPALIARLRERYWPGPLTLVLRAATEDGAFPALGSLAKDGWTGTRAPAHDVARGILDAAPFPVVMTSANLAGNDPAVDAASVREQFDEQALPLLIDAGPATLRESSTVLAVGPGRFEVLREGIVAEDELRRTAGLSLLFVCTGNTCRSPMAEALARRALHEALETTDETQFGFRVASAGVYAGPGSPASENSVLALDELGIDLNEHRSRPAIDRDVAARDRVYCMTASHRDALLSILPPDAGGGIDLLDPTGRDIPDPYGGPLEVYRKTRDAIVACVQARLTDWV